MPSQKVRREDVKGDESLCDYCTAKCCRYYAFPIDAPETRKEFDYLRWFMLHGRASVFVDNEVWYLMVHADCNHLLPDNRCGIYYERPQICREYSTDGCEYDGDGIYDKFFETPDQVWEYSQAVLPLETPRRFSSAPATPAEVKLPMLN
ncbi:MAG: YkgJ family cysteine cluster protein [Planctomycetaceae bacterium]